MTANLATNLKKRSWIITSILAVAALAYVFLLFLPGQKAVEKLREELRDKQDFVAQAALLAPVTSDVEQKLETTKKFNEDWLATAPTETKLAGLYGRISAAAAASGTTTVRFDPQPAIKMDALTKIPLVLGSEGSFDQVFDLLQRLETLPETVWMEDLRLEPGGEDGKQLQCEVILAIFAANEDNSN